MYSDVKVSVGERGCSSDDRSLDGCMEVAGVCESDPEFATEVWSRGACELNVGVE